MMLDLGMMLHLLTGEEPQRLADGHRHLDVDRQGCLLRRKHDQGSRASRSQGHLQRDQHRRRERACKIKNTYSFL